jgi:signal transduction histidine kinase/ActR/RegA family two-component response regulator
LELKGLSLTGEVLLAYSMQAMVCLVVAWLLADFARRQPKPHLRWWSFSWVACFCYLVTAAMALGAFGLLKMPANDWRRVLISTASLTAGLLQPYYMALGTYESAKGRPVRERTRRRVLIVLLIAAVAITIGSIWCPYRVAARLGTRSLVAGAVFLFAAVKLLRGRKRHGSMGQAILGWSALVYSLEQFQITGCTIAQQVWKTDFVFTYYLGFLDVILQVFMGVGMLTWHLESERARTEAAMRALEASQEGLRQAQKMEVVGRLAGGVAHDFNNLMTVMYGATEALAELHPPGSAPHEFVQDLEDALHRAKGLTSQLLAFSRKQVARTELLDMAEHVRQGEKMLHRLVGSDVLMRTECAPGQHFVNADPAQLSQVLMNLAVNARDAMPKGGELTIHVDARTVASDEAQRLQIEPGDYEIIEIADTGIGMSDEVQNHLFEPFYTTKPQGQGTGLGLSTVYGIVRAARGAVDVRSAPGQGTSVTIYWPRASASEERMHAAAAPPARLTHHARVLVAEDDPPIREMLVRLLEKQGFAVVTAKDGAEALMALRADPQFELLITDVIMPGMDGSELIAAVRASHPRMRILAISGFTGDLSSRSIPADVAWLQKPFSTTDLLQVIDHVLQRDATSARTGG